MTSAAIGYENIYIIADAHPPSTWSKNFIDYVAGRGFLNIDGMKKVMWGTDWPVQTITQSLKELSVHELPAGALHGLLGENAIRILGLDGPSNH